MIVFGTRGTTFKGKSLEGVVCPGCGDASLSSFGVARYFHIWWIPFFPTERVIGVKCAKCGGEFDGEGLSAEVKRTVRKDIFENQSTLHHFTGLMLGGLLFMFLCLSLSAGRVSTAGNIEDPKVNDYYVVKMRKIYDDVDRKFRYGILKVTNVDGDDIQCDAADQGFSGSVAAKRFLQKGKREDELSYGRATLDLTRAKLMKMYRGGVIRYVIRLR